jgi:hypothetical protein
VDRQKEAGKLRAVQGRKTQVEALLLVQLTQTADRMLLAVCGLEAG